MNFFADESVDQPIVEHLRAEGHQRLPADGGREPLWDFVTTAAAHEHVRPHRASAAC